MHLLIFEKSNVFFVMIMLPIITYPHHKHIGEKKISPSEQPTVQQILSETEKYLL